MTHLLSPLTSEPSLILAQLAGLDQISSNLGTDLGSSLLNVLKAVIILIIGWIVSGLVKGFVKKILNATDIDNRIASWVTGRRGGESFPIEEWIANLFCWLVRLFVIVAFLNALQLEAVSAPLNSLLNQVTSFIPQIVGAGILLGVAWILATLVKTLVSRSLNAFGLEEKLGQATGERADFALGDTIGNVLYWFIFLLFLPSVLSTLELDGTLSPVQDMVQDVLSSLPNIFKAVLIGLVGWFVAQIVRKIVSNLLAATGVNSFGERLGLGGGRGQSLSSILGTLVFVIVLIPAAISALQALQIDAISGPAIDMLRQVSTWLPKLLGASALLAVFYVAARFVSELVTNLLTDLGFNNFLEWLGISSSASVANAPVESSGTDQPTVLQSDSISNKTPSEIVGAIVFIAIMLVATFQIVNTLQLTALTEVLSTILAIAGQVLIGAVIFAIGLYIANLAHKLVMSSGINQASLLAQAVRVIILAFVGAIALTEAGIGLDIVNLAFGLLLGAVAVAIALAFGLGGRDVAKEELRSWVDSLKEK